jgi:hypothetical protein
MMSEKLRAGLLGGMALATCLAAASGAVSAPQGPAATGQACQALSRIGLADTTITSATLVPAGPYVGTEGPATAASPAINLPAHCRVAGVIRPTPRSDIRFEVWLPAGGWNDRFLGVGNGGFAGEINYRGGLVEAVQRGYAAASTDTGHVGNAGASAWAVGNVEAQIDYGHRAVHLTAVNAKAIVQAFYGRRPRLSVFSSCSNGGRQALMEAQRYPGDYDGIIAGAPAYDWTRTAQMFIWNGQSLTRTPQSNLPPAKLPAIQAAILAQCDGLDGVRDGLVRDPRQCGFRASSLLCTGADNNQCLLPDQAAALDRIHQGPPPSHGRRIGFMAAGAEAYPGGWTGWIAADNPAMTAGGLYGLSIPRDFAGMQGLTLAGFDFQRDGVRLDSAMGSILNATNPDLSAFFGRGGKLILWHGWADAAVAPELTIDYYDQVMARMGPRAGRSMRLFMVPGVQHCGAGPGLNTFGQSAAPTQPADASADIGAAMEAWIERGRAPDRIVGVSARNHVVAVRDRNLADVARTGLICAYPNVSIWNGRGDVNRAESYTCGRARIAASVRPAR